MLLVFSFFPLAQKQTAVKTSPGKAPVQRTSPIVKPSPQSVSKADFILLNQKAEAAREKGNIPEAIQIYQRLISIRPQWAEGWWYLGSLFYETDQFEPGGRAFARLTALQPQNGLGWAMLGLCEYQMRKWIPSIQHLKKALQLGLGDDQDLVRVVRYHQAMLLIRGRQFEEAQTLLNFFAVEHRGEDPVLEAFGLMTLRIPGDMQNLSPEDQEMVRSFGKAAFLDAEQKRDEAFELYQRLEQTYSGRPNVAYAMGVALLVRREQEKALSYFQRELARDPDHLASLLQIALRSASSGNFEEGLPYAQRATRVDPANFTAFYALGRLYLHKNDVPKAIAALEKAAALEPNLPAIFYSLFQAYLKANRLADSEKALATFQKLKQIQKQKEAGKSSN